jgi:hypothetical protein
MMYLVRIEEHRLKNEIWTSQTNKVVFYRKILPIDVIYQHCNSTKLRSQWSNTSSWTVFTRILT